MVVMARVCALPTFRIATTRSRHSFGISLFSSITVILYHTNARTAAMTARTSSSRRFQAPNLPCPREPSLVPTRTAARRHVRSRSTLRLKRPHHRSVAQVRTKVAFDSNCWARSGAETPRKSATFSAICSTFGRSAAFSAVASVSTSRRSSGIAFTRAR